MTFGGESVYRQAIQRSRLHDGPVTGLVANHIQILILMVSITVHFLAINPLIMLSVM